MVVDTSRRAVAPEPPSVVGSRPRRTPRRWWAATAVAVGLAIALAIALGDGAVQPDVNTRTDIPVRTDYVANPGMGWQDADRRDGAFAQSIEYLRPTGGWAQLNPAAGVYDWSVIDDALAAATDRGNRLSLRIYTMRHPDVDGHKVPRWVLDDGAVITDGEPDYSNAVYQRHWATFVEALRERYDGHPRLAFIDISGYGNYNEWSWQDQTRWDPSWRDPGTLDGQARRRLADMFLGGSGTIRARGADGGLVTVEYDYPGFASTQLVMPYAGIRQSLWYALDARADVGWRYDCLGQISVEDLRELGDVALGRWRSAPMVYEFCSQVDWSTVDDAVRLTHPVLIHDNATTDEERLSALLGGIGYRYVLDSARWPARARRGDTFTVDMWWRNTGSSRAYERLGPDLELRVGLRRATDAPVAVATAPTAVTTWTPGTAVEVDVDVAVPRDLATGTHQLVAAIVDTATDRPIRLAMADADDGWYPVGRIDVAGDR